MYLIKLIAFLAITTLAFCYGVDAFGQSTPANDNATGPLGDSDVVFVYGSQVPGDAYHPAERPHTDNAGPMIISGVSPPTVIVFLRPFVITARVPHKVAPGVTYHAPRTHKRAALNHGSVLARHNVQRIAASYTSGDLPGAPQNFAASDPCEMVGPRLDGSKVRICGGTVIAVIDVDGTVHADPFTPGLD